MCALGDAPPIIRHLPLRLKTNFLSDFIPIWPVQTEIEKISLYRNSDLR